MGLFDSNQAFDFLRGAGSIYATNKGIQGQRDLGNAAMEAARASANQMKTDTQFKPFTLTSGIGSASATAEGGLGVTLSPEQQALQNQLQGMGTSALGFLDDPAAREAEQTSLINMLTQGGQGGREADIMARLQAAVAPENERARMALEERLFSQGRSGVATNQYGGTPEALVLEKAIAEQQANLGVSAMEQARKEQEIQSTQTLQGLQEARQRIGTLGDLGLGALKQSYDPTQSLINLLQPTLGAADISAAGQRQGAQLGASMLQAGMGAQTSAQAQANVLEQIRTQALTNILLGQTPQSDGTGGSSGLFQSLFDEYFKQEF